MQIFHDFREINSDEGIHAFVARYGLIEEPTPPNTHILGIYSGIYNGVPLTLKHRWHDPSGPFSIQPDIHKAKLEISGHPVQDVSYQG